jgi:hypothetical protein|tara:strand:+ start:1552 stop:1911 length:360 start_codon:yes stop_codon:yes gene_type:complete
MKMRKVYGKSREDSCPFCGKQGVTKNSQGIPVCLEHKETKLNDLKCICGEYLDIKEGKFGSYFNCINCGNINFKKALEMNQGRNLFKANKIKKESTHVVKKIRFEPKETIIRSDELDLM